MLDLLSYFSLTESYKLPDALMGALLDKEKRSDLLSRFVQDDLDLSKDNFVDSFQSEHGDRDKFKQDFTPKGISEIVARIIPLSQNIADVCAGTGSLTIQAWNLNRSAFFHCEEKSERAVPFLLLNLALRNIHGEVLVGDVLTRTLNAVYRLTPAEQFSEISLVEKPSERKYQAVISNPPYSLKWEPKEDERFCYGLAPAKAADYAFVQHGLSLLPDEGKAVFVLPHGVLFRGNSEGSIRRKLLESKIIDSIIGLPDNTFANTCIPVCLLICQKNSSDVLIIDASRECSKHAKLNVIEQVNVERIVETYRQRQSVERFASVVSLQQLEENDFNLNIPRYVDTFEAPEVPKLEDTLNELSQINNDIKLNQSELARTLNTLTGYSKQETEAVRTWIASL